MISSMTAFASGTGQSGAMSWVLEMRGVNAKGLDIRLRLPEQMMPREQAIRVKLAKHFARGSIGLTVRVEDGAGGQAAVHLDHDVLDAYLDAAIHVRRKARDLGIKLRESTATDYLSLRGVVAASEQDATFPDADILADLDVAIVAFAAMRDSEGAALDLVLREQLAQIKALMAKAGTLAEARKDQVAATLKANLARVMDNADGADPTRVAQELALLAVKADVSEELDRLRAHVDATAGLLDQAGPVGRKLDFLMQEFNREANTLCSKSGSVELTQVALDLKAVIDQMREQVQNVE